ncbi:hypothetical protein SeMB42_g05974 [Synchytrium endobioticum]|uniref:DNA replication licensing factor MCM7 n=1 Tax=Synchytrium endobioticum TaxID=286115 RepID=A0A507CS92_9FUNG|nr:hypothetical protein SeMB42_g05974 [Synchytrium endobioticum]TPX42042.1 hypothetical protein SeLEV6574_g05792 [Synchytrium endobioticum]
MATGPRPVAIASANIPINYKQEADKISTFLEKFSDNAAAMTASPVASSQGRPRKYIDRLQDVADRTSNNITIELDDIEAYDPTDDVVPNIERNAYRYLKLFEQAIDKVLPVNQEAPNDNSDPLDVIMFQRRQRDAARDVAEAGFPDDLTRRYSVNFAPRSKAKALSVREVKGSSIGHLVTVRGMVTRVSNVKPQAQILTLSCDKCGAECFQQVKSHSFTPITNCDSKECKENSTKGKLYVQTRASKFLKFQEVKLQELTDQVPMGHIPRTMTVHLFESLTRTVNPGDMVLISGIFIPTPYQTGRGRITGGLLTDTLLYAQKVTHLKKQYSKMQSTPEIEAKVMALSQDPDVYAKLARSIAPEIYGHESVKKALLLLLVGGTTKETGDGMKIRGDLNMLLMGDPGVAKSQLLKYISKVSPRGIYTTGRGSSGVGLTAAVMKDPVTEEMVLEGGALVLADNGIACIDEFDKMDENDRTAIHEVMEQQTISISKAGITTTLNARTSILAAANPQFGRYNPRYKPSENMNLPPALLSRFDLLFLLLDEANQDEDLRLGQHVTYVHMHSTHPRVEGEPDPVDIDVMRQFIAKARSYRPVVPPGVAEYIVKLYVQFRSGEDYLSEFQYTTARTLLSLIRMATARARVRFAEEVTIADVEEAHFLIESSKASLIRQSRKAKRDPSGDILEIARRMATDTYGYLTLPVEYALLKERVISRGMSEEDLNRAIRDYEVADIWMLIGNGTRLQFLYNEAGGEEEAEQEDQQPEEIEDEDL